MPNTRKTPSSTSSRYGRALATLATLLATAAGAQSRTTLPAFELERLELNANGQGSLVIGTGEMLPEKTFRFTVAGHYQNEPLVIRQDGERLGAVVQDRFMVHVLGVWAPTSWLELHGQVPVVVNQNSDRFIDSTIAPPRRAGLSTPYVALRVGVLSQRTEAPVDLAVELGTGLPVGEAAALSRDMGPRFTPRVLLGRNFEGFRAGLEASMLFRPAYSFPQGTLRDQLGDQVRLGASVTTLGNGLRGELAVRAALPLAREPQALEVLFGGRLPLAEGAELFGLLGPGFGAGPGTPNFRALFGLALGEAGFRCVAGGQHTPEQCPNLDDDSDGVANGGDSCPTDGGNVDAKGCPIKDADKDGVADAEDKCPDVAGDEKFKGCPPDKDSDGVADADDKCPSQAGVVQLGGCPDSDKDGIADAADKCPSQAGVEKFQGCPDTDGDGIADAKDKCPSEAGIAELRGCAAKDTDSDTVADHRDNCPNEAGDPANAGCPAAKKQLVAIAEKKIEIKDRVYFDTGKSTIQRRSFALLDQIATVLADHPEIEKLGVEGHTDNVGEPERNKQLSQERAQAVLDYLVGKGVQATRLKAEGFGQERPVATNDTEEGRATNRRVDFLILGDE